MVWLGIPRGVLRDVVVMWVRVVLCVPALLVHMHAHVWGVIPAPQRDEILHSSRKGRGIVRKSDFFKSSSLKGDEGLRAVPTNLHVQVLTVEERCVDPDTPQGFGRGPNKPPKAAPPPPTPTLTAGTLALLGTACVCSWRLIVCVRSCAFFACV